MRGRPSKPFVLPYEPEYTAHRDNDRVSRVTLLHRHVREDVLAPPVAPDLSEQEEAPATTLPK